MLIDTKIAISMANVLNQRGFITCADFSICNDDDFGDYVCSQESELRNNGYTGGKLEPWNSSFRIPTAYDYGVLDTKSNPSIERLDSYTCATGLQLEQSGLKARELKSLLIGLQFRCDCGHSTNIHPETIPFQKRELGIHLIEAQCEACKKQINSPYDIYRLFLSLP